MRILSIEGFFKVHGSGKLGTKVDDLIQFGPIFYALEMVPAKGNVIAIDFFDRLLELGNLSEDNSSEDFESLSCPDFMLDLNREILADIEVGKAYAIRSSALSERGGIGIYESVFFVATGDLETDMAKLWEKEKQVYASEFTPSAKAWRDKVALPMGMAILIQPVIGKKFGENFLPVASGNGYTSYQGLPTLRVCYGLGTRAVNGEGIVLNIKPDILDHFRKKMYIQEKADAIDLTTGEVIEIDAQTEALYEAAEDCDIRYLFDSMAKLRAAGNFYFEWVSDGCLAYIVQISPYKDKISEEISFDPPENSSLLCQGTDVASTGRNICDGGIVYVQTWTSKDCEVLASLNHSLKNYLLILPQQAFTIAIRGTEEPGRVKFSQFSNANAIVEKQIIHSQEAVDAMISRGIIVSQHGENQSGATHFQQICERTEILFLGGRINSKLLSELSGGKRVHKDAMIAFWPNQAEMVTDLSRRIGFVYIANSANTEGVKYSLQQIHTWTLVLREASSAAKAAGESDLEGYLLEVSDLIIPNSQNLPSFDPFEFDPILISEIGLDALTKSLREVIKNGDRYVAQLEWKYDMCEYLEEFLVRLENK